VDVLINNYLDGIGACYFAFVPDPPAQGSSQGNSGYMYLMDDAGDGHYVSGVKTPALSHIPGWNW
jgi:hypothetical protein